MKPKVDLFVINKVKEKRLEKNLSQADLANRLKMQSPIEQYIIDKVKEIRIAKNISQAEIAYVLGFESTSYIGEIEIVKFKNAKNVNHLNEIAKILDCSPKNFWPETPL